MFYIYSRKIEHIKLYCRAGPKRPISSLPLPSENRESEVAYLVFTMQKRKPPRWSITKTSYLREIGFGTSFSIVSCLVYGFDIVFNAPSSKGRKNLDENSWERASKVRTQFSKISSLDHLIIQKWIKF